MNAAQTGFLHGYMHKTAGEPDMVDSATSTLNAGIRNIGGIPGWANTVREFLGNASGREPTETIQNLVKNKVTDPGEISNQLSTAMDQTPFGRVVAQNEALQGEAGKAGVDLNDQPQDPLRAYGQDVSLSNPPPAFSTVYPQMQSRANTLLKLILERKKAAAPAVR